MTEDDPAVSGNENEWAADAYDEDVGFVHEYGRSVVALLDPAPGGASSTWAAGPGTSPPPSPTRSAPTA